MWRERRAFAYYYQNAASAVGGELDMDFWQRLVPRVCQSEPAVWDALISISALFESPETISVARKNQNHRDALEWYSRALSQVRQQIARGAVDTFVGLISCMLFLCIEALRGGVEEAIQLYGQGVQLILALRAQIAAGWATATEAAVLDETIIPIFIRLGLIGFSFSQPKLALLREAASTPKRADISWRSLRNEIARLGVETQFLQHACEEHLLSADGPYVPKELLDLQNNLSLELSNWYTAFLSLKSSQVNDTGTIALFTATYEALYIMLNISTSSSEVITDQFLPNFQTIVDQSRIALDASLRCDGTQPPITFDINPGVVLWFTCLRCREPSIRREAIALLRRSPRVQGFHSSSSAVIFGERIMHFEEVKSIAITQYSATIDPSIPTIPISVRPISSSQSRDSSSNLQGEASRIRCSLADQIPEEARIGHFTVLQPEVGSSASLTPEVIAKWNLPRDQPILSFWRNERHPVDQSWRMVCEYVPMGVVP